MAELLRFVAAFFKRPKFDTDSFGLKCVYRGELLFLLIAGVATLGNNYFGVSVTCQTSKGHMPDMDAYCFNHGTVIYSVTTNETYFEFPLFVDLPRPTKYNRKVRIDPGLYSIDMEPEFILLARITWYPFIYFGLAFVVYLPRFIWRLIQGRIIEGTVRNLNDINLRADVLKEALKLASSRFSEDLWQHTWFGFRYGVILLLNFLMLSLVTLFLVFYVARGNEYFAIDSLMFLEEPYDTYPMRLATIFPQRASCIRTRFGLAGNLEWDDGLCELHYGKVNQLFFALLFWVNFANLLSVTRELLWYLIRIIIPPLNRWNIRRNLGVRITSDVGKTVQKLNFGSIFVVEMLLKNMHPHHVFDILLYVKFDLENQRFAMKERMRGNL